MEEQTENININNMDKPTEQVKKTRGRPKADPTKEKPPKETKQKKETYLKLDSETKQLQDIQFKLRAFKKAEKEYTDALKLLQNPIKIKAEPKPRARKPKEIKKEDTKEQKTETEKI